MKTLTLWVKLWNLNKKEDSTSFGPQQGQQTMNLELWSKPFVVPQSGMLEFVQHEGMVVTRFHRSWSWSMILVQFHTADGMVWPRIKMIQTEYRLVSVGVSVGPAYMQGSSMHERCERHPKRHTQKRKWSPIWNWWPLFIWTWITGYRFWGVPYSIGYAGFVSCFKVQGNFLLLCSSSNFVGYSYI